MTWKSSVTWKPPFGVGGVLFSLTSCEFSHTQSACLELDTSQVRSGVRKGHSQPHLCPSHSPWGVFQKVRNTELDY